MTRVYIKVGIYKGGFVLNCIAMEVALHSNAQEREQFETMADLFSIFQATENLEKAYIRDAISADEYPLDCASFI